MTKHCDYMDVCNRVAYARPAMDQHIPKDGKAPSAEAIRRLVICDAILQQDEPKIEQVKPCDTCPRALGWLSM